MSNWRRTLFALCVSQFLAMVGFCFLYPFIPLYIQTLGVKGVAEIAFWSGLSNSVGNVAMALTGPIWGLLADRYGRKLMVLRSNFGAAAVIASMALVVNVQQFVVLRFLQGALTGTIAACNTLMAAEAPENRRGAALGSLQMAVFTGITVGPLLGGSAVDAFGYQFSYLIGAALLLIAGLVVVFLVHEEYQPGQTGARTERFGFRDGLKLLVVGGGVLAMLMVARIVLRSASGVISPVLALIVQELSPAANYTALITGTVSSMSAVGAAVGSPLGGRLGDRYGHRTLLIISSLLAALCFVPQTWVASVGGLVFWQFLSGIGVGGMLATSMALLAHHIPHGREGVVFGLDASATGISGALGPMAGAAVVGAFGLRAPFLMAALLLVAGTVVVIVGVPHARRPALDGSVGSD